MFEYNENVALCIWWDKGEGVYYEFLKPGKTVTAKISRNI